MDMDRGMDRRMDMDMDMDRDMDMGMDMVMGVNQRAQSSRACVGGRPQRE